ncbi:hypothetical protein Lalb_Chr18g0050891 [Lupinus albus]|uniref:Uncharacterized protein n=1 Tax=Lupinus albus TaxID=3870 RepID=A0A6A4NXS9_LUPAL|nr:hypothetical protein Lalb_Chr18g0050891 [Lupinus albus]
MLLHAAVSTQIPLDTSQSDSNFKIVFFITARHTISSLQFHKVTNFGVKSKWVFFFLFY